MISKIKKDIFQRSKLKNVGYMPQNGESQQEYDYRICKTDIEELKSYTFVVSRFFKFNGYSMKDFGYNVYVYDKDGNYVNDPIVKEKCRGEFFENLKDVE